jgi:hypothetical protein
MVSTTALTAWSAAVWSNILGRVRWIARLPYYDFVARFKHGEFS